MRAQKIFEVTTIFQVLLASTTFLIPVSAKPQRSFGHGLTRRADKPGIGVEVEFGNVVIKAPKDLTDDQLEAIKGKDLVPVGFDGGSKTNWKLTVEIASGSKPKKLMPEAIVDGIQNKVGARQTKQIGGEIFNFLDKWAPTRPNEVKIPGFEALGPFTVEWPNPWRGSDKMNFATQVTAAMPLAAVLQILRDTKERKSNPLATPENRNMDKFQILSKNDFASFRNIKQSDVNDEFLGYFSLLATYCVLAKNTDPAEGPKRLVNIMPRTDFSAQYNKFIEPKLKEQLKDTSLYDIVKKVSGSNDNLAKEAFKWTPGVRHEVPDNWNGKAGDLESGNLEVGKFLNYLQGRDPASKEDLERKDLVKLMDLALRHGQVGGLGDKMENMLDTDKPVPIFEFRDLTRITGSALSDSMGSFEDKVIDYHHQFAKDESVKDDKPSKGKSLSIAMFSTVSPHGGFADVDIKWRFYTVSAGKAVGSCGETDGQEITPQGPSDPKLDSNTSSDNPPWPAGTFKLKIEDQDCEYKCDGTNPGRLFCPNKQITCVEDSAKSKKEGTKKCGSYSFFHAAVFCDF